MNVHAASKCLPSWAAIFSSRIGAGRERRPLAATGVNCSVRPLLVRLRQHPPRRADFGVEMRAQRRCAALAQAPRPFLDDGRATAAACAPPACLAAPRTERRADASSPQSSTRSSDRANIVLGLGREAGDDVGAERDVRPQPAQRRRRR